MPFQPMHIWRPIVKGAACGAISTWASPNQTAPHEAHPEEETSLSPAGCGSTIKIRQSLPGGLQANIRCPPDDRGKADGGFIGAWSLL